MPLETGKPVTPDRLELQSLQGLVVEGGHLERPEDSFRRLENFDLTITGALKKINGFARFVPGIGTGSIVYDSPIVAIRSYLREPGVGNPRLVGFSQQGKIYDLVTGALMADMGIDIGFPCIIIMPGYNSITEDGEGGQIQYLIIIPSTGEVPRAFDGNVIKIVGLANPFAVPREAPLWPMRVRHVAYRLDTDDTTAELVITPGSEVHHIDLEPHIRLLASRRYRFTFWDPDTRWESSPSVVNENTIIGPGGLSVGQDWKIYQIGISLAGSIPDNARIRMYASRQGSVEFFLLRTLFNNEGEQICDEDDGSFLMGDLNGELLYDGLPHTNFIPIDGDPYRINRDPFDDRDTIGVGPRTDGINYSPVGDDLLVEPAPVKGENDPPPAAIYGAVYQNRLWLVPLKEPSTVVFSKVAEFNAFSVPNVFQFLSDDADPIVALRMEFASLIVGRMRKLSRITGTDFTDFTVTHLEQGYGFLGRHLHANADGSLYFLNKEGLYRFAMDAPEHVSVPIKPLFTNCDKVEMATRMNMCVDSTNGVMYIGLRTAFFNEFKQEEDIILCYDYSQKSPYSVIRGTALPHPAVGEVLFNPLYSMQLVQFNGKERFLLGAGDNRVYEYEAGNGNHVALVETQRLPIKNHSNKKIFRYLHVENDPEKFDISTTPTYEFLYSASVDGKDFGEERPLRHRNFLGMNGKFIVIKIRHRTTFGQYPEDPVPLLYNFTLEWVDVGDARC